MNKLITVLMMVASCPLFGFSFFEKEDQILERELNWCVKYIDFKSVDVVSNLHVGWNEMFDRNLKNFRLLQFSGGDGVAVIKTALMSYDTERRKHITVVAIIPTTFIDKQYCKQIFYYYENNVNDPVCNGLIIRHLNNFKKKR